MFYTNFCQAVLISHPNSLPMAFPMLQHAVLLLLFVFPSWPLVFSQANPEIRLGSSLIASDNSSSWRSPSGEFAFGFHQLGNQSLFLLAIWFEKIPEKTLVWYANGDNPAPKGSKVELTSDGQFMLRDPKGGEIWRPQKADNIVSHATMLDTGNFVLEDRNQNLTVWESFKNPVNTILPTQVLELGGTLYSQKSESNYSKGRFQLRLQPGGSLELITVDPESGTAYEAYYRSNSIFVAPNSGDSVERMIFDESGRIYVLLRNGTGTVNIASGSTSSSGGHYYRATLDHDGVFRLYNRDKKVGSHNTSSWSVMKNTPYDICDATPSSLGSGICGFNSYCIVDEEGLPQCLCPDEYSHLDPSDRKQGCKPNFELPSCQKDGWEGNKDAVEFRELAATNWPLSDYQLQRGPDFDKEKCKQSCKDDCLCAVAIHGGDMCWKKKLPLSNGRHSKIAFKYTTALIKVPKNNATPRCRDKSTLTLVGSVIFGSSAFFNLFLLSAILGVAVFCHQKKPTKLKSVSSRFATTIVRTYSYRELEVATHGFKEKLGRGAFGTVYKGVLASDPGGAVAVKKLDKVIQEGEKEFETEVAAIGQTHHRNLVGLLGYCNEGEHRLLVYEFMSNGSLANLLFGISRPEWSQRVQIASGIARGLMYLHEECCTQIIHCDIKPQNILLDDHFTPRISDFGLAKLLLADQTRITRTGIRGTIGYFAPEWFRKGSITAKVDVYSYGGMLLEMICCKSSVVFGDNEEEEALTDWAYECYMEGKLEEMVEDDEEARKDMKRAERMVKVAFWCIQEDPGLRPTMRKVSQMLDGVVEVPVPPRPFGVFMSLS